MNVFVNETFTVNETRKAHLKFNWNNIIVVRCICIWSLDHGEQRHKHSLFTVIVEDKLSE